MHTLQAHTAGDYAVCLYLPVNGAGDTWRLAHGWIENKGWWW